MATGFGLRPVRHKNGSPYNGECNIYHIPSSNSATIGIGEVLVLAGSMDSANVVPEVAQAAENSSAVIGVVVGFASSAIGTAIPYASAPYLPASTAGYVLVADDPDLIFQVQEDAVGGAVSAANVGSMYYAALSYASSTANTNTATGMSKTMLDSDSASSSSTSTQLQIIGVAKTPGNAAAQSDGAVLEVMINSHVLAH